MTVEFWAQCIGFCALITSVIIYSRKERSKLLLFKAVQDILWGAHYLLLACYSAAATSLICVTRSVVFYHNNKKWAKSKLWVLAYLAFYLISAALTWQNVYSILPSLASCTSTVAFYQKKTEHTKLLQILASLITLTYTILQSHSLTVYLGVTLTIVTASISLWRSFRTRKASANPQHPYPG